MSSDDLIGSVLQGRYKVLSLIAAGGMGVVYRGERLHFGRAVAIKFLHAPLAADKDLLRRFELEAKALSRLGHPHCVSVIDFGVEGGAPYMVLDYVTGKNLREVMDAGVMPPARALQIVRQLLAGLAHAHGQGIVHRDIKPANIMLSEATGTGDHVRILDFGLAKLRDAVGNDVSHSQIAVGTPSYMSPEQASGDKVDARSDLYSAGILVFELLAGKKPFAADEAWELLAKHRTQAPPKLAEVAPERKLSPELEAAVAKALAKAPADRFQSAAEMMEALAAAPEAARGATSPPTSAPAAQIAAPASPAAAPAAASQAPTRPAPRALPFAPTDAVAVGEDTEASLAAPRGSRGGLVLLTLLVAGVAGVVSWKLSRRSAQRHATAKAAAAGPALLPRPAGPLAPAGLGRDAAVPVHLSGGMSELPPSDAAAPVAVAAPIDAAAAVPAVAVAPAQPDAAAPDAALAVAEPDAGPSGESDEPVAAVPEAAHVEEAEVDAPPPAVTPTTHPVTSVADALALITAGKKLDAIVGLQRLRHQNPKSAYIPYLLGNLYFERLWFTQGLDAYGDAVANDHGYRGRATLNRNAIRALGSTKTHGRAAALIKRVLGRSALPYLRRAAAADADSQVRERAAALVKALDPKRRRR